MSLVWRSDCRSDVGNRRRINEDACLDNGGIGLWVVADGMGGHVSGDVASRMVIDAFEGLAPPISLEEFSYAVRERLNHANRRLREMAKNAGQDVVMGSTVVAFLVVRDRSICVWAGDSRAYLLRERRLSRLTRDHSVVQEMVERGEIGLELAASHPSSNVITRAVGVSDTLELEERPCDLMPGDVVLLCSDGLTGEMSEAEIAQLLGIGSCVEASAALVRRTLDLDARDNVTVAVIRFDAADETRPAYGPGGSSWQ